MKKLIAGAAAAAAITAMPVALSTTNAHAATAAPDRCHRLVYYEVLRQNKGWIKIFQTCGDHQPIRARAECFKDNTSKHEYRNGSWRTANRKWSTAGCLNGWYIDNGGYQIGGSNKYHVLWRYPGIPV